MALSDQKSLTPGAGNNPKAPVIFTREPPLVSIVVPAYNASKTLAETVESLVNQNYPKIEVVIVNDGSTDNTAEIARGLIAANPKRSIKLLNQPNEGVSAARNLGLKATAGDFVGSLDSDDCAAPTFVSTAMKYLEDGKFNLFSSNVEVFGAHPGEWTPNEYSKLTLRYDNCIPSFSLYDRSFFERTGGYKVSISFVEDWEYWINCSRGDLKVAQHREKLFRYRSSDTGLASAYINGRQKDCQALVIAYNEDLYSVEEVLNAHTALSEVPEQTAKLIVKMDGTHPNEWQLKLWLGILAEKRGDFDSAADFYQKSWVLANNKNWQPLFRLAVMVSQSTRRQEIPPLLEIVRLLRPDLARYCHLMMNPPAPQQA